MVGLARGVGVMVWAGAMLAAVSCAPRPTSPPPPRGEMTLRAVDPIALAGDLRRASETWHTRVVALTSEITAQTDNRLVREACLRLKIRSAASKRQLATQTDPRTAYLEAWIALIQFREYHASGGGQDLFGPFQERIIELADVGLRGLVELGKRHFPPEQIDAAGAEIAELARRDALAGVAIADERGALQRWTAMDFAGSRTVGRLLAVPMSPISGLQGVGDTPQAIARFAESVVGVGQVVEDLPQVVRWHLELLMYDASDLPVAVDLRRDFEQLSGAFVQLAERVDTLPEELRHELVELLAESDASQEKMQLTLVESRRTIESLTEAIDKATVLSENVTAAAGEIHKLVGDGDKAPAADAGPGTSVQDIHALLDRANVLTTDLRGLVGDLHRPLPADSSLQQTLAEAQRRADASIDKLTWRGAVLIGAAFLAALAYHFITRRTRGRTPPGA